jgi:hypothetical protein
MGEGLGLLFKVSPVTGLDLGVGAYAISALGGGDNNVLASSIDKNLVDWNYVKYTFNIGYTMSDLFKVTATVRNQNRAGGTSHRDETMKSIIGARILAVKDLTAIVEAELDNLWYDFDKTGKITFYETVGYKLGSLGFGLNAAQYLLMADNSDISLRFNPWVSYTLGKLVPRLDVVYFIGGQVDGSSGTAEGKYGRKNYAAKNDNDLSVIGVRPSVKINFDSRTALEIGDVVNFEKGGSYGAGAKDSRFTNVFYVDLAVKF